MEDSLLHGGVFFYLAQSHKYNRLLARKTAGTKRAHLSVVVRRKVNSYKNRSIASDILTKRGKGVVALAELT